MRYARPAVLSRHVLLRTWRETERRGRASCLQVHRCSDRS